MTAPTDRLIRRIRRDFARGTDDEVVARLTALSPDDSSERIQAALVLGAAGKWSRFEAQLRRLEKDWREVLLVGGLAGENWAELLAAELPNAAAASADKAAAGQARADAGKVAPERAPRRDWRHPRWIPPRGR